MSTPAFIDTNVPMYAAGRPHPCREAAREVIRRIVAGELEAWTDVEVLQEILHRYFAIGERAAGLAVFDAFRAIMEDRVLPLTEAELVLARQLAGESPNLSPRDLVHLAVMRNHGLTRIVSADTGFDAVDWVKREKLQPDRT